MKPFFIISLIVCSFYSYSQNVGIGISTPVEKLEVNGNIKSAGLVLTSGGNTSDFLTKSSTNGTVGYRKGHGAVAVNFIIALQGIFPSQGGGGVPYTEPILGEIRMFAGNFAPTGWALCTGQILPIQQNQALFSLLGFSYGGNGASTFALPDLRGAAPVSQGTSTAGYSWILGQKEN